MSFKENLIHARSHIIFIIAMLVAFGLAIRLETWKLNNVSGGGVVIAQSLGALPPVRTRVLTEEEMNFAKVAWQYFKVNYHEQTGMVNSVDGYSSATMWDTASYLNALISAHRLGLVGKKEFDERVSKLLVSLSKIALFDGALPNKAYNTATLQMVNYKNEPVSNGIGWSAIDIGRVLVPLNIISWNYSAHTQEVRKVLAHWKLDRLLDKGVLIGAAMGKDGKIKLLQEGRLGYEEYAAKSFLLLGYDAFEAMKYTDHIAYMNMYGTQIATDDRTVEKLGAHNYVVSEPYILDGLEYGWDRNSAELAWRVFHVQEERSKSIGKLVAVSEDNIDQAPYFVYNTVFTDGKAWNAITDDGKDASAFKSLSTKAAFGWNALYGTTYSQSLVRAVKSLNDPKRGWYSGVYDTSNRPNRAITANTNAIILESLCYQQFGRLVGNYKEGDTK
jgi:Protein of unknown function (DUF3131)